MNNTEVEIRSRGVSYLPPSPPSPLLPVSLTASLSAYLPSLSSQGAYSGGRLDENGLRALLSRIVFVLTECHKSEDFVPAKRLLTTSLVYHIEDPTKVGEKVFLFSYIKSQSIWHSLRFWNACFFQSVQETRAKMMDQMR
ncbi:hypothetical protein TSMEX_004429 [Taenia solium]|eukprot:TsM_000032200 transcript=TsM_000032200 gene=TsM_000032200